MVTGLILTAVMSSFMNIDYLTNYDGDTFQVTLPGVPEVFGQNISIRIRGIDSAEIKAPDLCEKYDALESRRALQKLLEGKKVDLLNCSRDKYFRLLCDVRVSGFIDVKSYMLTNRFAVTYDGETKPHWICKRMMP